MCTSLQALFLNLDLAAIISTLVGAAITWFVAWLYYKRAGTELKGEATLLRKANMAMVYMLEHPDAHIEVRRDDAGNPIGLIVSATARAEGRASVEGSIADAQTDS